MSNLAKEPIAYLLVFTLFKSIFWMGLVPVFQAPDEQNHFAYIQFVAETGRRPIPWEEKNFSAELEQTLKFIGFSQTGYHPFYNPEFNKEVSDDNKSKIIEIAKGSRRDFVKVAAGSANPPLYYFGGALFYKALESQNILSRVYAVRFFSVLLGLASVYFAYLATKLFVPGSTSLQIIVPTIISLQPSFSFTTATITIDALTILWTSIMIYLWGVIIKRGLSPGVVLATVSISLISILVREVGTIALLATPTLIVFKLKIKKLFKIVLLVCLAILLFLFFRTDLLLGAVANSPIAEVFRIFGNYSKQFNFINSQVSSGQLARSVSLYFYSFARDFNANIFAWYWGVFGWLEVQLPVNAYRILKILTIVSAIGIIRILFKNNIKDNIMSRRGVLFLLFTSMIIAFPVFLFDFQKFVTEPGPFGFQGRYLLPAIESQMILFVVGLTGLVSGKYRKNLYLLVIFLFFTLNLFSIWQMISFFYQSSNIGELVGRIGQYKPIIFNWYWMALLFVLFFSSFFMLVYKFASIQNESQGYAKKRVK